MATRGQPEHMNRSNGAGRVPLAPATTSISRAHVDPNIERDSLSTPMYEPVVRAEQIAPMLDCSTKTVLRMAKAGQIPAVHICKLWRFRRSAITAWLDARLQNIGTYHAGKLPCGSRPRVSHQEGKN